MAKATMDELVVTTSFAAAGTVALPSNCVGNNQINASDPIKSTKTEVQIHKQLAQAHGTAAIAERRVVHVARGAGTLVAVRVTPVVAATGDSTATVDVRKNGSTALTSTIAITNSHAAYSKVSGTPASSGTYAADDVFEVVLTVSAGTGTLPQGLAVDLVFREANGG